METSNVKWIHGYFPIPMGYGNLIAGILIIYLPQDTHHNLCIISLGYIASCLAVTTGMAFNISYRRLNLVKGNPKFENCSSLRAVNIE